MVIGIEYWAENICIHAAAEDCDSEDLTGLAAYPRAGLFGQKSNTTVTLLPRSVEKAINDGSDAGQSGFRRFQTLLT